MLTTVLISHKLPGRRVNSGNEHGAHPRERDEHWTFFRKGFFLNIRLARVGAALLGACLAAIPVTAGAQTTAGIDLDLSNGQHAESNVRYNFPLVPLPMLHFTARVKNFAIHLEAVPPLGPIGYGTASGYAPQATRLSYLVGTLRYYATGSRYFFGVGSTVLNQRTTTSQSRQSYFNLYTVNDSNDTAQLSRVTGSLYEAGYAVKLPKSAVEVIVGINPKLRANYYVDVAESHTVTLPNGSTHASHYGYGFMWPEHGAQVESSVRWTRDLIHMSISYGIRYINYTAAYDQSNRLADKNSLLMPFIGIARRIGH